MTALQLIQYVTDAIYVVIAALVTSQVIQRASLARIHSALFFGITAALVLESVTVQFLGAEAPEWLSDLVVILLITLPYLLLRLVDDYAPVRAWILRATEATAVPLGVAALFVMKLPPWYVLPLVFWFFAVSAYGAATFVQIAQRSTGVTQRRMQAVAAGALFLGGVLLVAGFATLLPPIGGVLSGLQQVLALASGVAFFVGFAPPQVLIRAWQEPELRRFLERAATLPRLGDTTAIVRALQDGTARTLGAGAAIGIWDPSAQVLYFSDPHQVLPSVMGESDYLAWRVFAEQTPRFYPDAARANPRLAAKYRQNRIAALLIAPISAGGERLGVVEVFTPHRPIFSEDDLELLRLLADQAAVILESRALIDEAARVRAHEEAARMKEDFLSAAAHDLKTPLTTLVAQAQFLERRSTTDPEAPPDVQGIKRIVKEARRLSTLVAELLDASRLERGQLVGEREAVDLVELARDVAQRDSYRTRRISVRADRPVIGMYDPRRIGQVIENLVDNAVKYSEESSEVRVSIGQMDGEARIAVTDLGIGIPATDLPHVFERFHRASNVDDRRYSGMGLGLFICKGIVEQHGGRIWVESQVGTGTTFHIALPVEGHA